MSTASLDSDASQLSNRGPSSTPRPALKHGIDKVKERVSLRRSFGPYGTAPATMAREQTLHTPERETRASSLSGMTVGGTAAAVPAIAAPSGRRGRAVEISYSSLLLLLWAVELAMLACYRGKFECAITVLVLCVISVLSKHGESRILIPVVFLSEHLLESSFGLNTCPVEFFASSVHAYLTLVPSHAKRGGKSAQDRNVVVQTILYALVGVAIIYVMALNKDSVLSLGAIGYVVFGYIFYIKLDSKLGENEAVLVSSIVGFYICDVFTNNYIEQDSHASRSSILTLSGPGFITSYTHIFSRGNMLCTIYMVSVVSLCARFCRVPVSKNSKSCDRPISRARITFVFWAAEIACSVTLITFMSYQFDGNAVVWIYHYLVDSRFRFYTLVWWAVSIPICVVLIDRYTGDFRQTVRRKLFHFLAVGSFTPAAMIDPPFLAFSLTAAASLGATIEVARRYQVAGSGFYTRFIANHIDERDSLKGVVRTHIYLLYGLGVSLIFRYRHQYPEMEAVPALMELSNNVIPGITALGIVDACAAIIGSSFFLGSRRALGRYLSNKVFTERMNTSITHKTTTGTLGGFVCGLAFWVLVLTIAEVPILGPVWYTFTMVFVCTVTECFMDGIDNLQLPLVVLGAVNNLFALIVPYKALWDNPFISRSNPTTAQSFASALSFSWVPQRGKH